MISKKIQQILHEQIKKEYYSSYMYLAMSTWCNSKSLEGFGNWLRVQSAEELEHALKFVRFVEERQGNVILESIEQPPVEYQSVVDIFKKTLAHEQFVTRSIHAICEAADAEKDYATKEFLGWFVKEQVEEEANAALIVDKLAMIGESMSGLLYLDKEMKKRAAD